MTTTSGTRIAKLQQLVSDAARKQRAKVRPAYHNDVVRLHTIAAAAIVLKGQPRIDEPLRLAWKRALRYFKVEVSDPLSHAGQREAARLLWPKINDGQEEATRFTVIFSTAPRWFLQFARTALDAYCLKFDLPQGAMPAIRWGSEGFEDAKRWPQLPWGIVGAGRLIRKSDDEFLAIALLSIGMACSQIDPDPDDQPPSEPRFFREMEFALELEKKPERTWTRYEPRRMHQFDARIASLLSCTAEEGRRRACREIALRSRK